MQQARAGQAGICCGRAHVAALRGSLLQRINAGPTPRAIMRRPAWPLLH